MTEDEYLFEERAGIIEFDGNVPRDIAEAEARKQLGMDTPIMLPDDYWIN